jgi:hypothetical protein
MGAGASADSLRWNLDLILDQRGADMADLPGGASGVLVRDYEEADRLETRTAPGVVSPLAELRGHERHAGEELGHMSQALNRLRARFARPSIPRQCRGRRRATAGDWRDRVESEPP